MLNVLLQFLIKYYVNCAENTVLCFSVEYLIIFLSFVSFFGGNWIFKLATILSVEQIHRLKKSQMEGNPFLFRLLKLTPLPSFNQS